MLFVVSVLIRFIAVVAAIPVCGAIATHIRAHWDTLSSHEQCGALGGLALALFGALACAFALASDLTDYTRSRRRKAAIRRRTIIF